MDVRENRLRRRRTIHLQDIVDEGAGQGISADLIALRAGEQTIQTVEIGFAAFDQLIQKFGLILKPARAFDVHREAFIKPARQGVPIRSTPDQDVRDLMPKHIFDGVIGIARRSGRKDHDQAGLAHGEGGNPR